MSVRAEVVSVEAQRDYLVGMDSLEGYSEYVGKHFLSGEWLDAVTEYSTANEIDTTDYFTQLTLTGLLTAQFGFASLRGSLERAEKHTWEKSATSLEHQTATAIYMARANETAFAIKDDLLTAHPIEEYLVPGVWGSFLPLSDSYVSSWYNHVHKASAEQLVVKASMRLQNVRIPISLPDRELNRRLVAFDFDNDRADQMPSAEFQRDIFPEVRTLVRNVVSPRIVFAA